jgi:DNA-binding response OmpR family regulator
MTASTRLAWVVEDSVTLALQLTRLLQELGYQVQHGDATRLRLPLVPAPALICVALLGTGYNGFKLLRRLAAAHQCPRLLLTASGRRTDFGWGLRAGATAVLAWPPTRDDLQRLLALPVE